MNNILVIIYISLIILLNNQAYTHHINKEPFRKKIIAIPKILSASDLNLYRNIIKFQNLGNWSESENIMKKISNMLLDGYVEYDKLMHPNKYRASFQELDNWLTKYDDYPVVMKRRVYRLMQRRAETDFQRKKKKLS